jgi:hypothetical protein
MKYVEPARKRGDSIVRIVAGDVHRSLRLTSRIALICNALSSRKFLEQNHLTLESRDGRLSGQGTTVTFIYRLSRREKIIERGNESAFLALRGIAKAAFQELGGGEEFLRREREHFYGLKTKQ